MSDKKIFRIIIALSVVVFGVVAGLYSLPKNTGIIPDWAKSLPLVNALLNGTCSVLLLASLYFIKNKNVKMHKRLNIITFILSALFLVSYIIFHSFGVETSFPADNPIRPFYLVILLTHILLAAVVLPLVLISFYFGLMGKVAQHRKIAKWTFPIWLYVTVTGVVVYLMISPYYQF